jgi:hypothetical protein
MVIAPEISSSKVVLHKTVPPVMAVYVPADWANELELTCEMDDFIRKKLRTRSSNLFFIKQ